jgi:hypothetical protein
MQQFVQFAHPGAPDNTGYMFSGFFGQHFKRGCQSGLQTFSPEFFSTAVFGNDLPLHLLHRCTSDSKTHFNFGQVLISG